MIVKKSQAEIERMARSGLVLAATHDLLRESATAGVSTGELDRIAERFIRDQGGVPTFKGYRGFPGSICASPNEMIVHGIPGDYRLKGGDIISLDVGVTLGGWVSDAAVTLRDRRDRRRPRAAARRDRGFAACRRRAGRGRQPHG